MINFDINWQLNNNNEFKADESSIIKITNALAKEIFDNGIQLGNDRQLLLQFADEVQSNDRIVTVTKGMHQAEKYNKKTYCHYTIRDTTNKAFHIYVLTEEDNYVNYIENAEAISEFDVIDRRLKWL